MAEQDRLDHAAQRFIRAAGSAVITSMGYEEFLDDSQIAHAYNSLATAFKKHVPDDVKWKFALWTVCGELLEQFWLDREEQDALAFPMTDDPSLENELEQNPETDRLTKYQTETDLKELTSQFRALLENLKDNLVSTDWVAVVPLEWRFGDLPVHTPLGEFGIINVSRHPAGSEELFAAFRDVLTREYGVDFSSGWGPNTYVGLEDHEFRKTKGYIPGRPMLAMRLARGSSTDNRRLFRERIILNQGLLLLCQVAYDYSNRDFLGRAAQATVLAPDSGVRFPDGLVRIPDLTLAFDRSSGTIEVWPTGLQSRYESPLGRPYKPELFLEFWRELAEPIVDLATRAPENKLTAAITRAVNFVGHCRHEALGELQLHAVIALETILTPFDQAHEGLVERLATFVAGLCGQDEGTRTAYYKATKALYRYRNHTVHRSERSMRRARTEDEAAFRLFTSCLRIIVGWARKSLDQKEEVDAEHWDDFRLRTVFATPPIVGGSVGKG